MRISIERNDPGFANYEKMMIAGPVHRILLDGIEQSMVLTADSDEGMVKRLKKNKDDSIVRSHDRSYAETEIVYGKVEIL